MKKKPVKNQQVGVRTKKSDRSAVDQKNLETLKNRIPLARSRSISRIELGFCAYAFFLEGEKSQNHRLIFSCSREAQPVVGRRVISIVRRCL